MPSGTLQDFQRLPLELRYRVDQLCTAFEAAWSQPTPPRLEPLLDQVPPAARTVLLTELLLIELDQRRQRGEQFEMGEFLSRFPQDRSLVESIWHGQARVPADSGTLPLAENVDLSGLLAPPREPPELGWLGMYRVLGILGRGGMGLVLRAEDSLLGRPVALKVMRPGALTDEIYRQRFFREARLAATLRSDHVVTIYQVGQEGSVPFLAMELLPGETLETRLKRPPLPDTATVLRWGREIAEGLQTAHAQGLVHRDIKPSNIWLEERTGLPARIKLLDFGLARPMQADTLLTESGVIVGTPSYMSPEQASGQALDARSDLFSLGCVLYELCTGKVAFSGPNVLAVLSALAHSTPRRVRELNPGVPVALAELIGDLLHKRPEQRPATAALVAARLQALQDDEARPRRRPLSRRWLAAALGLTCLLLLVLAVIQFFQAPPQHLPSAAPAAPVAAHDFLVVHGVEQPAFEQWLARCRDEGVRPTDLNIVSDGVRNRYTALARREQQSGDWDVSSRQSTDLGPALFLRKQGYHPVAVAPYHEKNETWYAALWERSTIPGWTVLYPVGSNRLRDSLEKAHAESHFPRHVGGYATPGGRQEFALTVEVLATPVPWNLHFALTAEQVAAVAADYRARQGWSPYLLRAYRDPRGEPRFLLVFIEENQPLEWDIQVDLLSTQLENELTRQPTRHFLPRSLASYLDGGQLRYGAIWVQSAAQLKE